MSPDRESDASDAPQRRAFLGGEGDAWEARNRTSEGLDSALIARLAQHLEPGDRVLEIGCGSGQNLRALDLHVTGLICHGIDPSTEAIATASEAAPHQRLAVGASDELPFNNAQFRLVLFGFCLYLCDRACCTRRSPKRIGCWKMDEAAALVSSPSWTSTLIIHIVVPTIIEGGSGPTRWITADSSLRTRPTCSATRSPSRTRNDHRRERVTRMSASRCGSFARTLSMGSPSAND